MGKFVWVIRRWWWPNIVYVLFVLIGNFDKRGVGDSWQPLNDVGFKTPANDLRWETDIAQPGLLLRC